MSVWSQSPGYANHSGKEERVKKCFTLSLTPLTFLRLKTLETKSKSWKLKCKNRVREGKRSKKGKNAKEKKIKKQRHEKTHEEMRKGFP